MSRKMQNLFIQNINQFGTSSIQSGFVLNFLDNHLGSKAAAFYEDDEVEKNQSCGECHPLKLWDLLFVHSLPALYPWIRVSCLNRRFTNLSSPSVSNIAVWD